MINLSETVRKELAQELEECFSGDSYKQASFLVNNYIGEFNSLEDYARQFFKMHYKNEIPIIGIRHYIDFKQLGETLSYGFLMVHLDPPNVHLFLCEGSSLNIEDLRIK